MSTNLLAQETSPYLLQHKDNPVHWRPWGVPALGEARAAGRPVLLSVGYAACHWCHVMAHESFENPETAALMNELFVSIKVDREERPDLDAVYQAALAMMGEQGGWPLTMFLTPEGDPFWGGTYFPDQARYGRPAFADVLKGVAATWAAHPDKVRHNVEALRDGLRRHFQEAPPAAAQTLSRALLDRAAKELLRAVDPVNGGLMGAPKFPQPFLFEFFWRAGLRTGDEALRQAVTLTLDRLCHGGIYDHLGGGFARYATDDRWLVPHFEKMLYDNALILDLLVLAWQETRSALYAQRVAETIEWSLREMIAEGGAFASSLDADSEGEEGRFYVWTAAEIDALLEGDDATWFKDAYDVRPEGNWEHGRNILHRNKAQPYAGEGFETMLADCRAVLFRAREERSRPGRDDKVLADWNGLMIAAIANAAFVFDNPRWLAAARLAFSVVAERMGDGDRLRHAMRLGRVQPHAVLDDYAAMTRAALALYEATGEGAYLDRARGWVAAADAHYWDGADGGYFLTADDAPDVPLRAKTAIDSAVPSGNALMAQGLARLHSLTGEAAYRERAEAIVAAFAGRVESQFTAMTGLANAFDALDEPLAVVVAGDPEGQPTQRLLRLVAETSLPNRALVRLRPGAELPPGHPAHGKGALAGRATAYVCRRAVCSAPATSPEALRKALGGA